MLSLALSLTGVGSVASTDLPTSPLHFVENRGQFPADVQYLARFGAQQVGLTTDGLIFHASERVAAPTAVIGPALSDSRLGTTSRGHVVRLRVLGATGQSRGTGLHRREQTQNFLFSPDRGGIIRDVPTFAGAEARNVAPGVGLRVYGHGDSARYDVLLAPGRADRSVVLQYDGAQNLRVGSDGTLMYDTSLGTVREAGRFAYEARTRRAVPFRIAVEAGNRVRLSVSQTDPNEVVVLDPMFRARASYVDFAGYESVRGLAAAPNGEIFVAGDIAGNDLPVGTGAYQTANAGNYDAYVLRMDPRLSSVRTATYVGGTNQDFAQDLKMLNDGSLVLAMTTDSSGLFTSPGAIQSFFWGWRDGYLIRLSSGLNSAIAATYMGAAGEERDLRLAMSPFGHVGVAGTTNYPDLGGFGQVNAPNYNNPNPYIGNDIAFYSVFNGTFTQVRQRAFAPVDGATQSGGIAFTSENHVVWALSVAPATAFFSSLGVTASYDDSSSGNEGVLLRIRRDGVTLGATYLGGNGIRPEDLALTSSGLVVVAGNADGELSGVSGSAAKATFDTVVNRDSFVATYTSNLLSRPAATYVGADAVFEAAKRVFVSPRGLITFTGYAQTGFPILNGPGSPMPGNGDFVVQRLNASLTSIVDSAAFGSSQFDDPTRAATLRGPYDNLLVAGASYGTDWAIPAGAFQTAPTGMTPPESAGIVQEVAFTRDPVRINVGTATIGGGTTRTFAGVEMNALHTLPVSVSVTSSNPTVASVDRASVVVPAGSFHSGSFKIVAQPVLVPTPVTISATASGTTVSRVITVLP